MDITTFRKLVDDPTVKDIFLLPAVAKCIAAGKIPTTEAMTYLSEKRPELFTQVGTLLDILNVRWSKSPDPVDHGVQGPG